LYNSIFRLGFLPAVAGCLSIVPCDAYPQLDRFSGRCFYRRPFGYWFFKNHKEIKLDSTIGVSKGISIQKKQKTQINLLPLSEKHLEI
jgi:hypothetical protein